jgi:site-specific recombinase XerD
MMKYISTERPVVDVDIHDVVKYASTLQNKNYSVHTIRKHIISIKAFFNFLVEFGIIPSSPANAIKRPKTPRNIDRKKAMDEGHLETLLAWSQFHPRHNALIRFLADTGCRIGGAHTLKVEDVDLENCVASVVEKGSKQRMVAFGEGAAEAIRIWLSLRPADSCEYVFSKTPKLQTVASLTKVFRRACINAGIGSYGPHSLRHRKGYQLSDNRVSLSVAATLLGHESTDTTLNYYPADWDRAEAVSRELSLDNKETKPSSNITPFPKKLVQ